MGVFRTGTADEVRARHWGKPRDVVGGDLWLEGGFARQDLRWNAGGELGRFDGMVGVGYQTNGTIGRRSAVQRYLGPYVSFRVLAARAPDSPSEQICAGPCDRATGPSRTDLSFLFHFGLNWGRGSL